MNNLDLDELPPLNMVPKLARIPRVNFYLPAEDIPGNQIKAYESQKKVRKTTYASDVKSESQLKGKGGKKQQKEENR